MHMRRKIEEKHEIGTKCIWENKIGIRTAGTYMGIKGISGRQVAFIPVGEEKPIYVDISQLNFE